MPQADPEDRELDSLLDEELETSLLDDCELFEDDCELFEDDDELCDCPEPLDEETDDRLDVDELLDCDPLDDELPQLSGPGSTQELLLYSRCQLWSNDPDPGSQPGLIRTFLNSTMLSCSWRMIGPFSRFHLGQ